jgi:uncharacterized membrane protein (UPF0127 family)
MHFDRIKKYPAPKLLAIATVLLGLAACASSAAEPMQQALPKVQVSIGANKVTAEVANTDLSRQIGLMNRENLGTDEGMLFVFKRIETQCMWMKNTLIDLDVAFADESGKILNIENMKAGTSDIHCSKGNAKLALEMNLNWFSERNIGEGEILQVPEVAVPAR